MARTTRKKDPLASPGASKTALVSPEAVVTPVESKGAEKKKPSKNARRTLFPSTSIDDKSVALVTPSIQKRSVSKIDQTKSPPAKRRLIFGKYVEVKECQRNVEKVYKIVRKLTGSIGGNGYSGPIYGELTMGSMQKMIDLMMEYTAFDSSSRFIDVGSGIGKPNLHVAQYPGVEFSCGVEMEHTRWSLGMTCLKAVLDQAVSDQKDNKWQSIQEEIQGNCVFLHKNIMEAKTFDPFTHVYMFSIGFPPPLWIYLSKMWNKSSSEFLICYHGPRAIIEDYEFDVELLTQTSTSMHGSKEGHMGYLYKRKTKKRGKENKIKCDKLFQKSWDLVQEGLEPLHEDVTQQLQSVMGSGRRTRRSHADNLTRY